MAMWVAYEFRATMTRYIKRLSTPLLYLPFVPRMADQNQIPPPVTDADAAAAAAAKKAKNEAKNEEKRRAKLAKLQAKQAKVCISAYSFDNDSMSNSTCL